MAMIPIYKQVISVMGLPRKQFAQLQHKMLSNLADAKGVAAGLSKSAQQTMLAAEELFLRARDDLLPDFHRQLGLLSIILKCLAAIAVLAFLDWLVYFIGRMTAASMYLLSLVALVPLDIPGCSVCAVLLAALLVKLVHATSVYAGKVGVSSAGTTGTAQQATRNVNFQAVLCNYNLIKFPFYSRASGNGVELHPIGMADGAQAPWPLHTNRDGRTPRPELNGCYAFSHSWQRMRHSIDLPAEMQSLQCNINLSKELGLISAESAQALGTEAATYLQTPGPLAFSIYIGGRQDCPVECALRVELQPEQGPLITWRTPVLGSYSGIEAVQIAANQNVGLAAADRVKVMQFMRPGHWRRIAHVFRECPQNLQRVTVFLEGKDGRYWAGRYGAKFSSPQLHFLQSDNLESYENGDGVPHYADAH